MEDYAREAREQGNDRQMNFFLGQRNANEGLYLIDDPEAALSPQRQLSLLSMLMQAVTKGSQFIIATSCKHRSVTCVTCRWRGRVLSHFEGRLSPVARA